MLISVMLMLLKLTLVIVSWLTVTLLTLRLNVESGDFRSERDETPEPGVLRVIRKIILDYNRQTPKPGVRMVIIKIT